jgi:hypothetical protein
VLARAFRARAELVFQAAAEAHGATEEELAERLAPDLGLTPEGWLPGVPRRRLVVRGLKVQILDEDGQPVGPPRPGVGDDVATLKREAHVVLKDGAARLRARMTLGQGMSVEHFAETYLMHPLLRALAAGVVWGAQDGDRLAFTFTVGATGPVDARGQPVPLPEGRTVVVVHPSQLTEAERAAWAARLQRQPSDPLRRLGEAARTPDELAARLAALQGREVQVATLLRLRAKGWDAAPQDGGLAPTLVRRGGAFGVVEVDFTPGLFLGNPLQYLAQRLEAVRVFLRPDAPPSLLSEVEWELSQALR